MTHNPAAPLALLPGPARRTWRAARLVPCALAVLVAALLLWLRPATVDRLDLIAYALMAPRHGVGADAAAVLAIDEESLATIGRWPWPRTVFAELIDQLREAGVPTVVLDILFTEPDRSDGQADARLAEAMARHGGVILPLAPALDASGNMAETLPLPALRAAAARLGHVDAEIDPDGQVRCIFLQAGIGRARHPALAWAALQQSAPKGAPASLPGLASGVRQPPGPRASTWRRDYGVMLPRMELPATVSVAQVLQSRATRDGLRGRVVFVGVTASGLGGELATPLAAERSNLAAVQLHAQAFEALRGGYQITPAGFGPGALYTLALLLPVAWWPRQARLPRDTWILAQGALPLLLSIAVLQLFQLWFAPFTAVLALAAAAVLWLLLQLRDGRRRVLRTRQHALSTLEAIGDGVITVNTRAIVRYANPVALRQLDHRPLVGQRLSQVVQLHDGGITLLDAALAECLQQGRPVHLSQLLRHADPHRPEQALQASVNPLRDAAGRLEGAVIVLSDVTDAVASASRLRHAATHDGLTGLPNRILLQERLSLALARAQRLGSSVGILFLDLDRFKRINDSLGHSHGDEVLRVTAQRLAAICRNTDFVVRWGGDEFVVVMEDVSGQEAVAAAAGKLVTALGEDIEVNGVRLASSCSVGIALAPHDGTEIDDLLAKADIAMYRAKSHPDAGFRFYSSELSVWTRERLALEVELRQALRDEDFEIHYQPQFELGVDHRLVGFEALLRWWRDPQTLVAPGEFITVAEESGLIVDIGAWVVHRVARDIAHWVGQGHQALPVAVNVSARQCVNRNIVEVVRAALHETGIDPALLKLEITETTAMTDPARVADLLHEINALGVCIAVDDFGTGYSSLAYLKRFPIDELKIDRSFIQDLAVDADDAAIVRATIALAHELGIGVIAEGVECAQQSAILVAQSCDRVQGYLYGRPQPLAQVTPLLASRVAQH